MLNYLINKDSIKVNNESKSWFSIDFLEKIVGKTSKFEKSSNEVSYCY